MIGNKHSTAWTASTKARKQRKYRYTAPAHLRRAFLGAHLSKALRQQYKRRAIPLRSGDKVKITRGSFAGKTGAVESTDIKSSTAIITGIERSKRDGSKHSVPIHASNLIIEELNLKDRRRIETKGPSTSAPEKKPSTTSAKPTEKKTKPSTT